MSEKHTLTVDGPIQHLTDCFYNNPTINGLLRALALDKAYVRGDGSYLFTEDGEKVLDMVSGYGSLPFGHNHPRLRELTRSETFQQLPGFAGGTVNPLAEKLARRLSDLCPQTPKVYFKGEVRPKKNLQDYMDDLARRAPVYHTVYANSGAESVEAAFKLARVKTGNHTIISLTSSFHGKTLSSLSATGQPKFQVAGYSPVEGHDYLPANDLEALRARLLLHDQGVAAKKVLNVLWGVGGASIHDDDTRKEVTRLAAEGSLPFNFFNLEKSEQDLRQLSKQTVAAMIVEPIQGEGGVRMLEEEYILGARKLCQQKGVLFILDEVQTGLGRTGYLFAHQRFKGLTWDMMTLAKALGAGEFPTAALLVHEDTWDDHFGIIHTSTFAGSSRACALADCVLDILQDEENDGLFLKEVQRKGQMFKSLLLELKAELDEELKTIYAKHGQTYDGPGLITDVRGEGLMLGIELGTLYEFNESILRELASQGGLTVLMASYLLSACGVRVAPTLSNSHVLRIQAPLTVTDEEIRHAVASLRRGLGMVRRNNLYELSRHLVQKAVTVDPKDTKDFLDPSKRIPQPEETEGLLKVGFFVHPLDPRNFGEFDPALAQFGTHENPETHEEPEINRLWHRIEAVLDPFTINVVKLTADTGEEILYRFQAVAETAQGFMDKRQSYGEEYAALQLEKGLVDPAAMEHLQRDSALYAMEKITKTKLLPGLETLKNWGASILGCGAYTSIVSNQCLFLSNHGLGVTSGNSFTCATSIQGAAVGAVKMNIDLRTARAAVVAASGNIGRLAARLITLDVPYLMLIGNPKKDFDSEVKPKMEELAFVIYEDAVALLDEAMEAAGSVEKVNASSLKGLALALWEDAEIMGMLYGPDRKLKTRTEIGRQIHRLLQSRRSANPAYQPWVDFTINYNVLAGQDIIISASSDVGTIIEPHHLRPGSVVVDVARPQDVSKRVADLRPDVLVMDGGVLKLPNLESFGWNFGYGFTPLAYACMTETAMMGWAGHTGHLSHGPFLHMKDITLTRQWAEKFGVELAGIRSFERPVSEEHVQTKLQKAQAVNARLAEKGLTWEDMVYQVFEKKLEHLATPEDVHRMIQDLPEDVRRERNLMVVSLASVKRQLSYYKNLVAGFQTSSVIAEMIQPKSA